MDHNTCQNCEVLKSQCLLLKEQVVTLTQKIDSLLDAVFRNKCDSSSQTLPICYHSLSTQTEMNITESFTQTHVTEEQSSPTLDESLSSIQEEILMDMFMKSSETDNNVSNINSQTYVPPLILLPFISLPNQPFSLFKLDALEQDTNFDTRLHNRHLCYYGSSIYSYNGIRHKPKPIPASGNYLCHILEHIKSVLPDFQFNSVLLTKYNNGLDNLGFHSDNEPEIMPNSDIVTISLGQTRIAKFRCLSVGNDYPEQELVLNHGNVMIMSRNSQNFFQHSIAADESENPRISITLRMLTDSSGFQPRSDPIILPSSPIESAMVEQTSIIINQSEVQNSSENFTLYIGDSLLKNLDNTKMSSSSQKAHVFSYPGATVGGICSKLRSDPEFLTFDHRKVSKIYILCGTNNVDKLLHIPFNMNSDFIGKQVHQPSENEIYRVKTELAQLANFLNDQCQAASINFINILPRESAVRNQIINSLNNYIKSLSNDIPFVKMVSTELNRNLFTLRNGYRKNNYFSNHGEDNVHLNSYGITRLAKHLKYLVHN